MFRAIISPNFRSTRLRVTVCGIMHPYNTDRKSRSAGSLEAEFLRFQASGRQHRGYIIPQAVTQSLVLLKMGGINAQNMLSWLELLISRYYCIYLMVYIIYSNDKLSSKYQIQFRIFVLLFFLFQNKLKHAELLYYVGVKIALAQ